MKLEDLASQVGQSLGTSDWLLIDQARINTFADCTDDHQFIHVNPELASQTPLGGTIAHGFLTLSLLAPLMAGACEPLTVRMSLNYGFEKVRFLSPVRSGQRIRGHFRLLELIEKAPGQWQQKIEATVEIEGAAKPALVAEWLIQHLT